MRLHVNGVGLHAVERGAGDAVVFVHGALGDYREWGPVAEQLAQGYRTLTYSRRYNHPNDNLRTGIDHSAAVEAEDLAALIRAQGIAPAHVVGVSYGAYTALLLALRDPELVRSLVVVETPLVRWLPDLAGGVEVAASFFDALWTPAGAAFRRGDLEGALRVALDFFAFDGAMDHVSPELLAMLRGNAREWEALTTSTDAFPLIAPEELGQLDVPVLVVSGERGLAVCRLTDPALARLLPRGEHLVIPKGTHDVCSEQPSVCAEAIRAFLARC
jgi:pimeloyl-ACP methyl ester carboxylesterase